MENDQDLNEVYNEIDSQIESLHNIFDRLNREKMAILTKDSDGALINQLISTLAGSKILISLSFKKIRREVDAIKIDGIDGMC